MFRKLLGIAGFGKAPSPKPTTGELERKHAIERLEQEPSEEGLRRRARSIQILTAEGIPYIDHLPVIASESESLRRSERDVVERLVALAVVAVKGETNDQKMATSIVRQFDAASFLSPAEHRFIQNPNPSEQELTSFTWRYEGVHVLLWAIGIYEDLGRPDAITDVPLLAKTLRELGTKGLMERASLRPQAEILDAADLIYRYNWAVTNARLQGNPAPAGLEGGVVYERHYALNWLIGYMGQAWDDISTDT